MTGRITANHPLSRLVYFAPFLTTGFVLFTFTTFYRNFLQCSRGYKCDLINLEPAFQAIRPDFATSAAGYVLRVNWTLAGGLYLVVSLAALLVSGIVIYQALHPHRVRSRLMLILVTLFVAADIGLYVAILTASDVNSPAQMLLEKTVAQVLPHINFYNRLFDALGMMVGATLAVAACTIIWRNPGETQDEKELMRRSRLLRVLLYAGATALIVGVFRLGASFNWGKDFWAADSSAGKDVSTLVTGIISSLGISYTLILGSVYVPTMIMLRARAEALAKVESPDEQEEWLKKHGLTLSYIAYVPRILAILGPIIAGPVGKFLSDLIETKPA